MKDRIKKIRSALNMTQSEFADELGLSKNYISLIETGQRTLGDQSIKVLCSNHNINPEWLREGIGDMFMPEDRYTDIARFIAELSKRPPDDFQVRLISVLAKLPSDKWECLEEIAKELAESDKTE